jgi:O-antigen/teichoic acid export membrane protein
VDQTTPVPAPQLTVTAVRRVGSATAAVTFATVAVNGLAYVPPVLGAHLLSPADLGILATALALTGIASVAGLGLQSAIAVHHARHGTVGNARQVTMMTAVIAGGAFVLGTPVVMWVLRLPATVPLLVAVVTTATVLGSRYLGELQGAQRFGRFAVAILVLAAGRFGGVVAGLVAGRSVIGALTLGAVVAVASVPALAVLVRRRAVRAATPRAVRAATPRAVRAATPRAVRAATPRAVRVATAGEVGDVPGLAAGHVAAAGFATLGMLAGSYADLLVARSVLPATQAGQYAVGAVLSRGALWAPGVVTVLALPVLARRSRRALLVAMACVIACGAVLVGAAALDGPLAMRLAGGSAYVSLAPLAAGFAAVGAFYAVVNVLVTDEIAARMRFPAAPMWLAAVALIVAGHLLAGPTVGAVLRLSLITAVATTVISGGLALLRFRGWIAYRPPDRAVSPS